MLFALAGGVSARQATVIASSTSDCVYELSFQPDLADLDPFLTPDTQAAFQQTHFVAVPAGASARLVRAEGKNLTPITTATRSMITTSMVGRPLAEMGTAVTVRGHRLIPVTVSPVVGDAVYQNVEITLSFSGGLIDGPAAPPDPFFERVLGPYVVNHSTAQAWPAQPVGAARMVPDGLFSLSGEWYKVEVAQTGLHRITGAELQAAGVSLTSLSSATIRLFSGGGQPLPVLTATARPVFQEISIRVEDGGDGQFGATDRIYFYGESVDRWVLDEAGLQQYVNNVYTDRNVYWLTTTGSFPGSAERMSSVSVAPVGTPDTTISTFSRRIRSEQDKVLLRETGGHIDSYHRWYWTDATNHTFSVSTSGYIPGDTATILIFTRTGGTYADLRLNGVAVPKFNCNTFNCLFRTTTLTGGLDEFSFDLQKSSIADVPYFDYMELDYRSRLLPVADKLDLMLAPFDGLAELTVLDNFTADPWILDLADPLHPVLLTGAVRSGNDLVAADADGGSRS